MQPVLARFGPEQQCQDPTTRTPLTTFTADTSPQSASHTTRMNSVGTNRFTAAPPSGRRPRR
jgi:hypothetical protein